MPLQSFLLLDHQLYCPVNVWLVFDPRIQNQPTPKYNVVKVLLVFKTCAILSASSSPIRLSYIQIFEASYDNLY